MNQRQRNELDRHITGNYGEDQEVFQVQPTNRHPIACLDHGFVRLVDHMGGDLAIVQAARVSYNADWRAGEDEGKDAKLISYLMKNQHTSPFEAVQLNFEIKCPIFVARQWHRHRTWSYNEISARYTTLDEGTYLPDAKNITLQDPKNKQARTTEQHPLAEKFRSQLDSAYHLANTLYKNLLEAGCPRELARAVLPVASYTRFFASVNLHNLFRFLGLRLHAHAQYEIRVYADALLELAKLVAPVAVGAFLYHHLNAVKPE